MKLVLAALAALTIMPAMAQQRSAPVSGWNRPLAEFPAAFNETAARQRIQIETVEVGCNDIHDPGPGRMCEYKIGQQLIAFISAGADRSTIERFDVYLEGPGDAAGVTELRGAFAVLAQLLEPAAPAARRTAATKEIQSQMISFALNSREATLGGTRFHLIVLRSVRSILRIERAA